MMNLHIMGIYDDFNKLCFEIIEEEIDLIQKQFYKWIFFDTENYLTKDLSKQANDFLWIQLFHYVIPYFSHNEQAKKANV